jgi:hypothetical protein
MGGKEDEGNSS